MLLREKCVTHIHTHSKHTQRAYTHIKWEMWRSTQADTCEIAHTRKMHFEWHAADVRTIVVIVAGGRFVCVCSGRRVGCAAFIYEHTPSETNWTRTNKRHIKKNIKPYKARGSLISLVNPPPILYDSSTQTILQIPADLQSTWARS